MSDDAPGDNAVLETLNALEDTLLEGCPPEMRWLADKASSLPRHAAATQQSHGDAVQPQIELEDERTRAEHVEEAMVEGWTRSANSPKHEAEGPSSQDHRRAP